MKDSEQTTLCVHQFSDGQAPRAPRHSLGGCCWDRHRALKGHPNKQIHPTQPEGKPISRTLEMPWTTRGLFGRSGPVGKRVRE